jgi:hypothetical protein
LEEPFALGHGAFESFVKDLFAAAAEGDLDAFWIFQARRDGA